MTCCGNAVTADGDLFCQQDENLSSEICDTLEYDNCVWIPQKHCPAEVKKQNIADSPTGCCYQPNPDEADNLFGTTADYTSEGLGDDIPAILCGGGLYNEDGTSVFAEATTCEAVQAGFQTLLTEYELAQAAAATVAVTTAAPARI